ncbi:MAG: hypothetical protein ACOVLE_16340 [Pirellula staleyi]
MTDQEIIDAIDAEIEGIEVANRNIRLGSLGAAETILGNIAFINGLRFARELIAKRMEAGK